MIRISINETERSNSGLDQTQGEKAVLPWPEAWCAQPYLKCTQEYLSGFENNIEANSELKIPSTLSKLSSRQQKFRI